MQLGCLIAQTGRPPVRAIPDEESQQLKALVVRRRQLIQIGDCLASNALCRRRLMHDSGDPFPDHGTKTTFELPTRL